jgi:hypothetical protein
MAARGAGAHFERRGGVGGGGHGNVAGQGGEAGRTSCQSGESSQAMIDTSSGQEGENPTTATLELIEGMCISAPEIGKFAMIPASTRPVDLVLDGACNALAGVLHLVRTQTDDPALLTPSTG